MVEAKLSEQVIVSKIKSSKTDFDLSTDGLIKLKEVRVSDKIIEAMMGGSLKTGQEEKNAQLSSQGTLFLGVPLNASSLYVKKDNKLVEILPIVAEGKTSVKKAMFGAFLGIGNDVHYIRGKKAVIRLNNKKPVFYTKMNPSSFSIVKLIYKSGNDIRYVVTGSNTIPLGFNKEANDFFELFPKEELLDGEYAVISSTTFFDFGIDGVSGEQSSQKISKPSEEAGNKE